MRTTHKKFFLVGCFAAETEGFEPSYRLGTGKLISSQPRYGHFGTSPYLHSITQVAAKKNTFFHIF